MKRHLGVEVVAYLLCAGTILLLTWASPLASRLATQTRELTASESDDAHGFGTSSAPLISTAVANAVALPTGVGLFEGDAVIADIVADGVRWPDRPYQLTADPGTIQAHGATVFGGAAVNNTIQPLDLQSGIYVTSCPIATGWLGQQDTIVGLASPSVVTNYCVCVDAASSELKFIPAPSFALTQSGGQDVRGITFNAAESPLDELNMVVQSAIRNLSVTQLAPNVSDGPGIFLQLSATQPGAPSPSTVNFTLMATTPEPALTETSARTADSVTLDSLWNAVKKFIQIDFVEQASECQPSDRSQCESRTD